MSTVQRHSGAERANGVRREKLDTSSGIFQLQRVKSSNGGHERARKRSRGRRRKMRTRKPDAARVGKIARISRLLV